MGKNKLETNFLKQSSNNFSFRSNVSYSSSSAMSESSIYPQGYEHCDAVKSLLFNHFSAIESLEKSSPGRGERSKPKDNCPTIEEYNSLNFDEIKKLWKERMDSNEEEKEK